MIIEGLDDVLPGGILLRHVPIELGFGGFDSPRDTEFFRYEFLFPGYYSRGEVTLIHGPNLPHAIEKANSCRAFDGAGHVWAVAIPRGGKKVAPKVAPWGKPPPSNAVEIEREEAPAPVEVGRG